MLTRAITAFSAQVAQVGRLTRRFQALSRRLQLAQLAQLAQKTHHEHTGALFLRKFLILRWLEVLEQVPARLCLPVFSLRLSAKQCRGPGSARARRADPSECPCRPMMSAISAQVMPSAPASVMILSTATWALLTALSIFLAVAASWTSSSHVIGDGGRPTRCTGLPLSLSAAIVYVSTGGSIAQIALRATEHVALFPATSLVGSTITLSSDRACAVQAPAPRPRYWDGKFDRLIQVADTDQHRVQFADQMRSAGRVGDGSPPLC